jgi:hypothetical protein
MARASSPLLGRPHVVADHGHHVVQHDDLAHARHLLGAAVVDAAQLAADDGAGAHRRDLHLAGHDIDAIDGLAVDLVGRVEPLDRLADQLEVLFRLQRRIGGRLQPPRACGQRAVGRLAPAGVVIDDAVGGAAGRRLDAPARSGGLHEHGASRGAGLAKVRIEIDDRGRTARRLPVRPGAAVQHVVRRRGFEPDLAEIGVQLVGQQLRQGGVDALAHLLLRDDQGDEALAVDADEGVGRELPVDGSGGGLRHGGVEPEQQAAAGGAAGLQQAAAGQALRVWSFG